jgi:DNA-binding IclR family transcriptional regulator
MLELARLAEMTRERTSLYVRDGEERVLLLRIYSPGSVNQSDGETSLSWPSRYGAEIA